MAVGVLCNRVVDGLQIESKYKTTLAEIAKRDGAYKGVPDEVRAMDVDGYERRNGGDAQRTMDAAVGIADDDRGANGRLMLVELKLNLKNYKNLINTRSELMGKEAHTRDILRELSTIEKNAVFVVPEKHLQVLKSAFGKVYRSAIVCSPTTFKEVVTLT
jgi:hypothetical protein